MAIISIPTSIGGVSIPGKTGQILSGPLAALFGGKNLTTANYPQDLSTDASKSHYVQFSIKEIIPQKYTPVSGTPPSVANIAANGAQAIGNGIVNGANAVVNNAVPVATTAVNGVVTGVSNLIQRPIDTLSQFGQGAADAVASGAASAGSWIQKETEQITNVLLTKQTTDLKAVISLYMPDTLTASYSADYTQINLRGPGGALGDTLTGIQTIASVAGSAAGAIKSDSSVINAVGSDPAAIDAAIRAGTSAVGGSDGLSAAILNAQGYATNPQMQMIYQGLEFRSFQLSFTFTPKSRAEAKTVDNIIYQFKYYSAPSFQSGKTVSNQSMYLIPPAIFNVSFMVKGIENKYLPKYADCVLEHVDVNYAPNGWAAHSDGAPIQTTLTLSFKEIEVVDKARLSTGYNNPSDKTGLR